MKLPLNIDCIIPENDSVRLLSQFVEEMELKDLYATYSRTRENQANPRQMLKIVLYSYMNHNYSSRLMETSCKRDINFMYLLEDAPAPDHSTFARFRSLHFAPCAEYVLAEMTNFLHELGEISGEAIFIDGTKIETCANKDTFVWKKAVTKNQAKLLEKLPDFVAECEKQYGIRLIYQNIVKIKHIKKLRKKLYSLKSEENIGFVHGCGKKKSPLERPIEKLEEYLEKLKEYTQKIHICGDRNSFSKTDNDATFMRMKEDAMGNGQLKAGYNVQHGVDSSRMGYQSQKTIYSYEDCSNCQYKSQCIKGNNSKTPLEERIKSLETSKVFNKYRKENLERILSYEGCLLRMNRSIQAEGSFGELKQDMGFGRFLCKGKQNILAESILLAMAHNINKLHNKIQSGRTTTHLYPLKEPA